VAFAVFFVLLGAIVMLTKGREYYKLFVLGVAAVVFAYVWWRGFLIEIKYGNLRYRSLFFHPTPVPLSEIGQAVTAVGLTGRSAQPIFRLELHDRADNTKSLLNINIKPFDRDELVQLTRVMEDAGIELHY
jgi:hypothetical protein